MEILAVNQELMRLLTSKPRDEPLVTSTRSQKTPALCSPYDAVYLNSLNEESFVSYLLLDGVWPKFPTPTLVRLPTQVSLIL
jgi:hypothetical protein